MQCQGEIHRNLASKGGGPGLCQIMTLAVGVLLNSGPAPHDPRDTTPGLHFNLNSNALLKCLPHWLL
jgi:hypothetical protein